MIIVDKPIEFIKKQIKDEEKILYEYTGTFEQMYIKETALQVNSYMKDYPQTQKKIFYVFVELAQNVGFYSEEKIEKDGKRIGIGSLIVYENENNYGFIIGNKINTGAFKVLERKCKIINALDRDALRELKRFQRNLIPGTHSNAHVGLIMVALTTRRQINIKSYVVDEDNSFFTLKIEAEKEKN